MSDALAAYLAERNRMLRELDVAAAKRFANGVGQAFQPADGHSADTIALAGLHKARIQWRDATEAEVEQSRAWLREKGFEIPERGEFVYAN